MRHRLGHLFTLAEDQLPVIWRESRFFKPKTRARKAPGNLTSTQPRRLFGAPAHVVVRKSHRSLS